MQREWHIATYYDLDFHSTASVDSDKDFQHHLIIYHPFCLQQRTSHLTPTSSFHIPLPLAEEQKVPKMLAGHTLQTEPNQIQNHLMYS